MRQLFSPWRSHYIESFKNPPKRQNGSLFTRLLAEGNDRKNLIVHRGELAFVIMNKFPYNSGHLMIVPYRRIRNFQKLTNDEMLEIMELIRLSVSALEKAMKPHGFNIGANLGRVAGAGIHDHVHFHVVPRWNGDTNFMPTLGDVKMISQDMTKSWKMLKRIFKQSGKK